MHVLTNTMPCHNCRLAHEGPENILRPSRRCICLWPQRYPSCSAITAVPFLSVSALFDRYFEDLKVAGVIQGSLHGTLTRFNRGGAEHERIVTTEHHAQFEIILNKIAHFRTTYSNFTLLSISAPQTTPYIYPQRSPGVDLTFLRNDIYTTPSTRCTTTGNSACTYTW